MGDLAIKIIRMVIKAVSPELRNVLVGAINDLKKRAEATSNEWDDMLLEVLEILLGLDEE